MPAHWNVDWQIDNWTDGRAHTHFATIHTIQNRKSNEHSFKYEPAFEFDLGATKLAVKNMAPPTTLVYL